MEAAYGDERLDEKFWRRASPEPNTGCWLWHGNTMKSGYGQTVKNDYAHRVSYEAFHGPISKGMHIDHSCGVRCCVNPAHLRQCTPKQNNGNTCPKGGASRFKGVSITRSGRWRAEARIGGVKRSLGTFDTEEEAAMAYDKAHADEFGEFAKTNAAMGLYTESRA